MKGKRWIDRKNHKPVELEIDGLPANPDISGDYPLITIETGQTSEIFGIYDLATLNEIRTHLDLLAREVFGEKALTVADVLAKIETLSAASKKRWEEADDELEGARAHAIGCILLELRQFITGGVK